jgi:CRP/FNR family transcriptional regulator, cyclic AMP receptor protein
LSSFAEILAHPAFVMLILAVSIGLCVVSVAALLISRHQNPRRSVASQLQQLRRVAFLGELDEGKLAKIARVVRELRVPADVYVIREQRAGEAMYIVVSGKLHILKRGTHDETLVQTVGAGDVIGEMALLNDARRVASARAVTPSVLLQIDRDDFFALLDAHPEVAEVVWAACEAHSIELAIADHSAKRGMPVAERTAWIAGRRSETVAAGSSTRAAEDGYLAVVTGAVVVGGKELRSAALIHTAKYQIVTARERSRLCWLP